MHLRCILYPYTGYYMYFFQVSPPPLTARRYPYSCIRITDIYGIHICKIDTSQPDIETETVTRETSTAAGIQKLVARRKVSDSKIPAIIKIITVRPDEQHTEEKAGLFLGVRI